MDYEAVIGLEVHVQLKTKSKMFTRVPYKYGAEQNTLTDEVVLGLPGTLPVLNKQAVFKTVKVGLMFDCEIAKESKWDRKNYFYPDLPKNYQISQFDKPLCIGGFVEIELPGKSRNIQGKHRKVALNRIHLEEDVGKLTHCNDISLVDYNRAGTPLIEIVTEPDLFSVEEVFAYLKSLKMHLQYAGVSDCDMEKGQLRCDGNVSVRPKGSSTLGTKVELKNMNSISGICNGLEYEIERQIELLQDGGKVIQETRRWDPDNNVSISMRSKEESHDYRYFPDPDLMPVRISEDTKQIIKNELPELPFKKQERYYKEFDLPFTVTSVICPDKCLAEFFEKAVALHKNPKAIANFIVNDLLRDLPSGEENVWARLKIGPEHVAELARLIDDNKISKQSAKEVFVEAIASGKMPAVIVKEKGLELTLDLDNLKHLCLAVIEEFPKPVAEFKAGKEKAINVLKGQIMKRTQGKVPAQEVDKMLLKCLTG